MLKIFLFGLLFCPQISFSQDSITNTGSKISSGDAQAILNYHNEIRHALKIPPLSWSAHVAAYAQKWADSLAASYNCRLKHRGNAGENGYAYGENLFEGGSSELFKPIDASISWYREKQQYTYRKLSEKNWYNTGHYTQMIWKNTKEIGVGMATCADGKVIVVANYNPAGNYMGEYPY